MKYYYVSYSISNSPYYRKENMTWFNLNDINWWCFIRMDYYLYADFIIFSCKNVLSFFRVIKMYYLILGILSNTSSTGARRPQTTTLFFLRNRDCISHIKDKVYIATFAKAPLENKKITIQPKQRSPGRLRRRRPEQPPDEPLPLWRLEEERVQDAAWSWSPSRRRNEVFDSLIE